MKKVELLAPCGNYESFLAAVHAGADAVYLAGNKFGARAYADNFTEETLVQVIKLAHLWDVKVYMTVNTLVKENEFDELYDYMFPYVEAGLDGVIIQDLGVFSFFQKKFPSLELHASTQMTITGTYGAMFLKKKGCVRVVPSRELSLSEIGEIKKKTGLEIEAFIHGAMCYCYSGKCLMSSFIGGRSGNRGRCAQPCRLPYQVGGNEQYYLSLKDMNTLEDIPRLMDAGIDSFKIEGRMKKPEYVAGVVSLYRKYIDLYLNSPDKFYIAEKDIKLLNRLYIRTETGNGYYDKPRGKDMITLSQPGYHGTSDAILQKLHDQYVRELPKIPVDFEFVLKKDKPIHGLAKICMTKPFHPSDRTESERTIICEREGEILGQAMNRAATEDDVRKQLTKIGNTPFVASSCSIQMDCDLFAPVKVLNDFRREFINQLTGTLTHWKTKDCKSDAVHVSSTDSDCLTEHECLTDCGEALPVHGDTTEREVITNRLIVSVMNEMQCRVALNSDADTVLIDADLLYDKMKSIENPGFCCENISFKQLVSYLIHMDETVFQKKMIGLKLPEIIRLRDEKYLESVTGMIQMHPDAISCNSLDALGYVKNIGYTGMIYGDAGLYTWNKAVVDYLKDDLDRFTVSLEQNSGEIRTLCKSLQEKTERLDVVVYGKAPVMVTANCLKLTSDQCDHNRQDVLMLEDRMHHDFPVYTNCNHCYNIIYNYLPTSLHDCIWMLLEDGITGFRVDFFDETERQAKRVIQTFQDLISSNFNKKNCENTKLFIETTSGHMKRGVQ